MRKIYILDSRLQPHKLITIIDVSLLLDWFYYWYAYAYVLNKWQIKNPYFTAKIKFHFNPSLSLHNPNPRTIVSMQGTQKCYHISQATIPIPILILTYLIRLLRIPPLPVLSSKPRPQEFSLVQQLNSRLGARAFTSSSHPGCIFTIMNKFQQLRSSYCCTHLTIVTIVKFCYHSPWLR